MKTHYNVIITDEQKYKDYWTGKMPHTTDAFNYWLNNPVSKADAAKKFRCHPETLTVHSVQLNKLGILKKEPIQLSGEINYANFASFVLTLIANQTKRSAYQYKLNKKFKQIIMDQNKELALGFLEELYFVLQKQEIVELLFPLDPEAVSLVEFVPDSSSKEKPE